MMAIPASTFPGCAIAAPPTPATFEIPPKPSEERPAQQSAAAHTDIENVAKGDPHFTVDRQRARQLALGLHTDAAQTFIKEAEFVSLGCFCGVSSALSAAGLRKAAYPFDWVRSSVEGVIHLFDSDFFDFLTFSAMKAEAGHQGFLSARWGGSFWHHKPDDQKDREDFIRRIERMLGLGKVPPSAPRVFVRAVNSTRELDASVTLYQSLQRALPEATVYLVVLIDFQQESGPLRVKDTCENLMFYQIHKSAWAGPADIHKFDAPYSEAVAFAIHYWTSQEGSRAEVKEFENIAQLSASCGQFDGGSPATELFAPKPFMGALINLRRQSNSKRLETSACVKKTPNPEPAGSLASSADCSGAGTPSSSEAGSSSSSQAIRPNLARGNSLQLPPNLQTSAASPSLARAFSLQLPPKLQTPAAVGQASSSAPKPLTSKSMCDPGLFDNMAKMHPVTGAQNQQVAQPQFANVRLPDDAKPGDVVYAHAFGKELRLEVPVEAATEKTLQLQLLNGAITFAVLATLTATAATGALATRAFVPACDQEGLLPLRGKSSR